MKEFIAEPGGRYTYADDIINLQDMVLAVGSLLDGCSNFRLPVPRRRHYPRIRLVRR